MQCVALVAAGGVGARLGAGVAKAFAELAGTSLLTHAVTRLAAAHEVSAVIVAVPADYLEVAKSMLGDTIPAATEAGTPTPVTVITGGVLRQDSVRRMLAAAPAQTTHVLVHDAARALAPTELADRVITALAAGAEAVIPVLPVVDTLASVADDRVTGTVARDGVRIVQTPQGFSYDLLVRAHDTNAGEWEATDDSSMVMRLGAEVHTIPGDRAAFKVTTPEDVLIARALLHR